MVDGALVMRWQARAKVRFFQAPPEDASMNTWFHLVLYDTVHVNDESMVKYKDLGCYCMSRQSEAMKRMTREELIRTLLQRGEDAVSWERGSW